MRDNRTGIGKGFAYVNFAERSSVLFACGQNHQLEIGGRKLRVFRCKNTTTATTATKSLKPPTSVGKKPFAGVEAVPRRQWKEKQKKRESRRKRKKNESLKASKRKKNRKT